MCSSAFVFPPASAVVAAGDQTIGECLERIHVVPLELGVVRERWLAEGRAERLPVPERLAIDPADEPLDVALAVVTGRAPTLPPTVVPVIG